MKNCINYGIDLGTTNSAIACFVKGEVKIFRDPSSWKDTIPSVVSYRDNKILVGTMAKVRLEKDPQNTKAIFKRKMGTSESFPIKTLGKSKTPIELSTEVLKYLKTFVTDEQVDAAVITIPASFDTIQSNATKEAGLKAGLKQVVLLQEPIAASLAYANQSKVKDMEDGHWLVYDFGGGTFDVALVKIENGEMRVLDHEGDNFLGGSDFDRMIVEKVIIPYLEDKGSFNNLEKEMKSASGKHNANYYKCLNVAETAKVELSAQTFAEMEFSLKDDNGEEIECLVNISRTQFEEMIRPKVDDTIEMVKKIFTRNSLSSTDINFVLMVGGSTYIPIIRNRVAELLNVEIRCDIDPTTAVAIGAAYYAGTKNKEFDTKVVKKTGELKVKMAFQKATKDLEELFAARVEGAGANFSYRILRNDGGFDTGIKLLQKQFSEELPLVPDSYNFFELFIYDSLGNVVPSDAETIGIAQGKFSVAGQPLPDDICLEIDDLDSERSTLLQIFARNTVLPTRTTIIRPLTKNVKKGSNDNVRINIVEGSNSLSPETARTIGYMELNGADLERDLIKGSDVEITVEMTESRDLSISVYVRMVDKEFKQTFNPKVRHVPVNLLKNQGQDLMKSIDSELREAESAQEFEKAALLKQLQRQTQKLNNELSEISNDDVTDSRYQLEDVKRKIAQGFQESISDKQLKTVLQDYETAKEECFELVEEHGNEMELQTVRDLLSQDSYLITSKNITKIKEQTSKFSSIHINVLWRVPGFLVAIFKDLIDNHSSRFKDQQTAKSLIESGVQAAKNQNWDRLRDIDQQLIGLLPVGTKVKGIGSVGI
jgi:molecular chaperone DnaK